MNNDILTDYELRGYESGSGYWNASGNGGGDDELYEYFKELKIEVYFNIPTQVVNYCKQMICNYE